MKRTFSNQAVCGMCGEEVAVKQMLKHVKACRQEHPLKEGKKKQKIFTLLATAPEYPGYFLYLEIEGGKKLSLLDYFLRDAWLECCGHLSQFVINGVRYSSYPDEDFGSEDLDMKVSLQKVLQEGIIFSHEYDFGTPTDLELKVVNVRETKESLPNGFLLVARNLPPTIGCKKCRVPATQVLMDYSEDHGAYCDDCVEKLFGDDTDMMLPVVNSPRMGVCGYTGD